MILLTPFSTVLRIDASTGDIIHAPLWPVQAGSVDLTLDVPACIEAPIAVQGLQDVVLMPGGDMGLVRITRNDEALHLHPGEPKAYMAPQQAMPFEFLLAAEADLAHLRHLLAHRWIAGGEAGSREVTPVLRDGFLLDIGDFMADLRRFMPGPVPEHGDRFGLTDGEASLVVSQSGARRDEILLRPAPPHWAVPFANSEAGFGAATNQRLRLPGAEEILTLPLTVCDADRAWLYKIPKVPFEQPVGRNRFTPAIVRQSDKFVLLARFVEGIVFDAHGGFGELGYLEGIGTGGNRHLPAPPGMRQEGERLFVDRGVLAAAPFLRGPHVVFYGGTLSNYTHWLIDGMLPLHAMLPHLPKGARLLLPGTLRGFGGNPTRICDHHDILRAFGFAGLPAVEIDAPFCRVEEIYWLENGPIHNMPAEQIQGLRAHVAGLRPPPARGDLRLYIARRGTRRVINAAELERFLAARKFTTHYLEDLSVDQQIDLFSQAEWVVAPHGAELGNLLFCRPGTKVLELAPDEEFRHYFSYMCNKLGLAHGILPCPTHDGGFFGDMNVNMEKFTALFRMLKSRL